MNLGVDPQFGEQITSMLRQGRKIEAIKILREATGCDLLDAKMVIDQYEAEALGGSQDQPTESPQHGQSYKPIEPKGCLGVLVLGLLG